jgi:microtubule-associated protein-like 6
VRGIDWSIDSSVIMSNSADLELLYWNARTGKQVSF